MDAHIPCVGTLQPRQSRQRPARDNAQAKHRVNVPRHPGTDESQRLLFMPVVMSLIAPPRALVWVISRISP